MMKHKTYDQLIERLQEHVSYILDMGTHEMLYMSPSAMDCFGIQTPEEYLGQKCYRLLHGINLPCTFCTNDRLSEEDPVTWLQYNQKLKKWVQLTDWLVELEGRKCRIEVMEEISGQQTWGQDLTAQLSMESVLLQCLQTLSKTRDLDYAMSSFLEMVSRFYCADRGYIIEFDFEKNILNNTFEWCAEGVTPEIDLLQNIPLDVVDDWVEKFRTDGEFFISSIHADLDPESMDYKLLQVQNVSTLMAAPLYFDGEICGFIGVDNPRENLKNMTLLRAASDFIVVELDKRRIMKEMEYLSYTDMLTKLYNRNRYKRDLKRYNKRALRSFGVILMDINSMNGINSTFGQQYGDSVIRKTAQLLRKVLPYDTYRVGGDEFLVMCPNVERDAFETVLVKLRAALESADCPVSMGSCWRCDDVAVEAQIQVADEQMRVEKQSHYREEYAEGMPMWDNPAKEILEEIAAGRFVVHYQPKVDLQTQAIVGAEALVRKLDKDGGLLSPGQFVPRYETRNVLMHLDIHVLDVALAAVRTLRSRGVDFCVSVNFSRSTLLMPDFVNNVLEMCQRHQVPADRIVLEVTETISTIGRERLKTLLQEIRQAGLRLSLDDFGSKYSNTSILADIEFDEVKLDKSLVNDLCKNVRSRIILKNLLEMCQELKDTLVVAEGIETEEQAAVLKELACDCGQGFYYYRPMPLEQIAQLMECAQNNGNE